MSSTAVPAPESAVTDADGHDEAHEDHPTDGKYIQIAIFLAVLTALEVATAFESVEDLLGVALIPSLLLMMFVKFWVVAMWFMHLRFDNKILTQLFMFGLVLATVVYVAALSAFGFWF